MDSSQPHKRPRLDDEEPSAQSPPAKTSKPDAAQSKRALEQSDFSHGKCVTELQIDLRRLEMREIKKIKGFHWCQPVAHSLSFLKIHDSVVKDWSGLETLTLLHVLDLTNVALNVVPRQIASLTQLRALMLTGCGLTELEHLRGKHHLNSLVVNKNRLTELPEILTTLTNLERLNASHNNLTADGLPDLSSLGQLTQVRLSHNTTLESLPSHFATWGRANGRGLERLHLSSTSIATDEAIAPLLDQGSTLIEVNIALTPLIKDSEDIYEARLKEALPKLRIYNTTRFDERYLERRDSKRESKKAKKESKRELKAAQAEEAAQAEHQKPVKEEKPTETQRRKRKRDSETTEMVTSRPADAVPLDHNADFISLNAESVAEERKLSRREVRAQAALKAGTKREGTTEEAPSTSQPPSTSRRPKKNKQGGGKGPRSVGGSLSAPPKVEPEPEPPIPTADEEQKKRTAVAGIVKVKGRKRQADGGAVEALLMGNKDDGMSGVGGW